MVFPLLVHTPARRGAGNEACRRTRTGLGGPAGHRHRGAAAVPYRTHARGTPGRLPAEGVAGVGEAGAVAWDGPAEWEDALLPARVTDGLAAALAFAGCAFDVADEQGLAHGDGYFHRHDLTNAPAGAKGCCGTSPFRTSILSRKSIGLRFEASTCPRGAGDRLNLAFDTRAR